MKPLKIIFPSLFFIFAFFFWSCSGKEEQKNETKEELSLPQQDDGTKQETAKEIQPGQEDTNPPDDAPSEAGDASKLSFDNFYTEFSHQLSMDGLPALSSFTHPELGIFFVFKPGASAMITRHGNWDALQAQAPYLKALFVDFECEAKETAQLPSFDCEAFSAEGCFYQQVAQANMLQNQYQQIADLMLVDFPKEEIALAKQADQKINIHMVSTDAYAALYFGLIEGKWYLIAVDLATYDCSA